MTRTGEQGNYRRRIEEHFVSHPDHDLFGSLLGAGPKHLKQTKGMWNVWKKSFPIISGSTRGAKCKGMEGIIAEGAEMVEEEADPEVEDTGLISAAQRVEHYETAGYGTARTYAEVVGDKEGAKLLQTTLREEEETDKKLTALAKSSINLAAAKWFLRSETSFFRSRPTRLPAVGYTPYDIELLVRAKFGASSCCAEAFPKRRSSRLGQSRFSAVLLNCYFDVRTGAISFEQTDAISS